MDVRRKELDNGVIVATEAMPQLRSVSIGVWVKGGSRLETDGAIGISHFIEHLLFKGTKSRSAADIAREIDGVGGQLNAFTDKEYVGFYAKVLDRHLALGFELLADIVLNPTFPRAEVERERNVIFEEIAMVEDSPSELVQDLFLEQFWSGHPLGRPIAGTRSSVARIKRADVERFFRMNYTAASTVVTVAGNIRHRRVQELARRHFSALRAGTSVETGPRPEVRGSRHSRRKPNLEQTHLCLGTISPAALEEDRFAVHVLSTILGGGMSSRLFQNIRERRGLVYSIYSSLNLYRDAGALVIYAAMAADNAPRVVELTCKEIRALKEKLVPDEELERAKDNIKDSMLLSLESSGSRMTHLAHQQIYYGRIYTVEETMRSIDRVGRRDLRRLANRIFDPGFLTMTALGSNSSGALDSVPLTV